MEFNSIFTNKLQCSLVFKTRNNSKSNLNSNFKELTSKLLTKFKVYKKQN